MAGERPRLPTTSAEAAFHAGLSLGVVLTCCACGLQAPEVLANGFLRNAKPPLGEAPEVNEAMLAARGAKPYCEKVSASVLRGALAAHSREDPASKIECLDSTACTSCPSPPPATGGHLGGGGAGVRAGYAGAALLLQGRQGVREPNHDGGEHLLLPQPAAAAPATSH